MQAKHPRQIIRAATFASGYAAREHAADAAADAAAAAAAAADGQLPPNLDAHLALALAGSLGLYHNLAVAVAQRCCQLARGAYRRLFLTLPLVDGRRARHRVGCFSARALLQAGSGVHVCMASAPDGRAACWLLRALRPRTARGWLTTPPTREARPPTTLPDTLTDLCFEAERVRVRRFLAVFDLKVFVRYVVLLCHAGVLLPPLLARLATHGGTLTRAVCAAASPNLPASTSRERSATKGELPAQVRRRRVARRVLSSLDRAGAWCVSWLGALPCGCCRRRARAGSEMWRENVPWPIRGPLPFHSKSLSWSYFLLLCVNNLSICHS